ncbi:MAG: rhodanese-like domain-containing protein [Balneolaceae bacterium]|nr:MAG: rhodanese-like domain-containing protein [Balneolaceae bacterium]
MDEITVEELKSKIENSEPFTLLDVREAHEYFMSDIEGTTRIPMDELKGRLNELKKDEEIIVMCRSGNRSGIAAKMLLENGYKKAFNLKGGINEWAKKIDPTLPEY